MRHQWFAISWFSELAGIGLVLGVVWLAANLCSQALRDKRIERQTDLIRLLVYSMVGAMLAFSIAQWPASIVYWVAQYNGFNTGAWVYHMFQNAARVGPWFFVLSFCIGASRYLRLRLGWLWGVNVLCLTFLAMLAALLELSRIRFGTIDNRWVTQCEEWYPGVRWLVGVLLPYWP